MKVHVVPAVTVEALAAQRSFSVETRLDRRAARGLVVGRVKQLKAVQTKDVESPLRQTGDRPRRSVAATRRGPHPVGQLAYAVPEFDSLDPNPSDQYGTGEDRPVGSGLLLPLG